MSIQRLTLSGIPGQRRFEVIEYCLRQFESRLELRLPNFIAVSGAASVCTYRTPKVASSWDPRDPVVRQIYFLEYITISGTDMRDLTLSLMLTLFWISDHH
jgi:hypothetical protein